jgi:hypothetical protein
MYGPWVRVPAGSQASKAKRIKPSQILDIVRVFCLHKVPKLSKNIKVVVRYSVRHKDDQK